ncbi:unnamed protein product [Arabis nemorensis]|uniref:SUEL-type lectin domain-containing protein n=1 Tax=Arabis nemorensis TaxID=586526 RepID=A0A565BVX0_9BRAS|nr:unnamed protein product [Arabis nemorensis]
MGTSHCRHRHGIILLLALFHSYVFGFDSKIDVSDDAKGIKIDRKRFISSSNNSNQSSKEYTECTNQEPDPGPMTRISCDKPRYVITKIDFADYGNPSGTCGQFRHGNCGAPATLRLVKKNCLGKEKCALLVTDEMFGPSYCKGTPMLAVQTTSNTEEETSFQWTSIASTRYSPPLFPIVSPTGSLLFGDRFGFVALQVFFLHHGLQTEASTQEIQHEFIREFGRLAAVGQVRFRHFPVWVCYIVVGIPRRVLLDYQVVHISQFENHDEFDHALEANILWNPILVVITVVVDHSMGIQLIL